MMRRCARCGRKSSAFLMKMWNGHNGYRRYQLCERCVKELAIEAQKDQVAASMPRDGRREGIPGAAVCTREWD